MHINLQEIVFLLIFQNYFRIGTMKKVKDLKVLDAKAAQNISILLGGSLKHMSYSAVRKCIMKCETKILNATILDLLIQVYITNIKY